MDHREREREAMVKFQVEGRGIHEPKVVHAMLSVERHFFVPREFKAYAYSDQPLPIGEEQTISQPYIVAYMLQSLSLRGDERVLDIGTGSGYATALLSLLTREVYSVEILPDLAKSGKELLERLGYRNIFFKTGDGLLGWPERSPFDVVFVSACLKKIPETLLEQTASDGKIIAPMVSGNTQQLILFRKTENGITARELTEVSFVPARAGFPPHGEGKDTEC